MLLNCGAGEDSWVETPLDCKEIQQVHPKGNQPWVFIGRTDAEAEAPNLWPPDVKNLLIWKDPDAGKDWRWEEKETTEDEMVGWNHQLNEREFRQVLGDSEGEGTLACCSPWGYKELDIAELLNNKSICLRIWIYTYGYIYTQSLSESQIYPVFLFAKSGNPKSKHYVQILTGKKIEM